VADRPDIDRLAQILARGLRGDGATSRYYRQQTNWEQYAAKIEAERAALDELVALARDLRQFCKEADADAKAAEADRATLAKVVIDVKKERDEARADRDRLADALRECPCLHDLAPEECRRSTLPMDEWCVRCAALSAADRETPA